VDVRGSALYRATIGLPAFCTARAATEDDDVRKRKSPTREEVRRALNMIGNWEEEEIADLI
jgi:hypothetical protein